MAETLALDLDEDTAITLSMLIHEGIESFKFKGQELTGVLHLPIEKRPEELKETQTINELMQLNDIILEEAQILYKEVGDIAAELNLGNKPNKPHIILKPDWNGKG